jgi:hypothetical protein
LKPPNRGGLRGLSATGGRGAVICRLFRRAWCASALCQHANRLVLLPPCCAHGNWGTLDAVVLCNRRGASRAPRTRILVQTNGVGFSIRPNQKRKPTEKAASPVSPLRGFPKGDIPLWRFFPPFLSAKKWGAAPRRRIIANVVTTSGIGRIAIRPYETGDAPTARRQSHIPFHFKRNKIVHLHSIFERKLL